MSIVTVKSYAKQAMKEIEKSTDARLIEFTETFCEIAKTLAPPPPKFGPIPFTGNNRDTIAAAGSFIGSPKVVASANKGTTEIPGELRRGQFAVFTQSGYGGFLEVGTSRMAARPYFAPAFQRAKSELK